MESLKQAYDTEVTLLEKLCECLKEERECLIAGKVKDLWPLREEKEKLCKGVKTQERVIDNQRREMEKRLGRERPDWIISYKKRIRDLKGEAAARSSENMKIVQDALDFIDGLIDAMINPEIQSQDYGRNAKMRSYPRILFKEA